MATENIVNKILLEEKFKEERYPVQDILTKLRDEEKTLNIKEDIEIGKILGRILDKGHLADEFMEIMPLYFDKINRWWKWDSVECYWREIDETDVLIMVGKAADVNVINSKERTEIINALKLKARERTPKETDGNIIQFKKEIIDFKTGDRYTAHPGLFVTNPIPWKVGKSSETSKFDKLFSEWVKSDDVKVLYEILAYCLLPSYPLERMFALLGSGSNGKSTYLKILYTFLGQKNICSTDLHNISSSRFESGRLYKKLACLMGETNLDALDKSSFIKRATSGKDPISIEFKNKGLIEVINYAKLIIATNNLPPTEDKTDGYYRRWNIIDFPNQFEKEVDVLKDITDEDYENLAAKCLEVLYDLMQKRCFSNDGTIQDRRKRYEEKSNPIDKFWLESIDSNDPDSNMPKWEFLQEINNYMKENHMRTLTERNITKLMKDKEVQDGLIRKEVTDIYGSRESKPVRVWIGIKWKK
jgi:putative DNA primase/helicase